MSNLTTNLNQLESDRTSLDSSRHPTDRALGLAALEAWEIYNQEGEALQLSESKGWLGAAAGALDLLVKKATGQGNETTLHDQAEKWKLERDLVGTVKGKIPRNEAANIREALQQIQQLGSAELKEKASFYLQPEYRAWKSGKRSY